jgi:chromosome segregation ATPase
MEQQALVLAHSELGVAAGELHAKLEAANSSHKEAAASLSASEVRAAELEGVLASCRRELEAARNAASEAAAAKAALEGRVTETGARVGELEAALLATQKEVTALIAIMSARKICRGVALVGNVGPVGPLKDHITRILHASAQCRLRRFRTKFMECLRCS